MPPVLPGLRVNGYRYRSDGKPLLETPPPHRSPFSLTLHSYSSLTPSTLRTVRPSLPRLSVGGGRTRPGSRVAPVGHSSPRTFRRSSWLPHTYSRVSPSPVCLPQVAPKLLFRIFLRGNTHILASHDSLINPRPTVWLRWCLIEQQHRLKNFGSSVGHRSPCDTVRSRSA